VQDVPHPLSAEGLAQYDYSIRDSLQIRLGPRVLDVYEVRVRPKDDRQPRAVGAVYIDRETGEVVRMAFSFTRAALKDEALEDVSVVLENGLIDGRFWLPRRQEIEIRRGRLIRVRTIVPFGRVQHIDRGSTIRRGESSVDAGKSAVTR